MNTTILAVLGPIGIVGGMMVLQAIAEKGIKRMYREFVPKKGRKC